MKRAYLGSRLGLAHGSLAQCFGSVVMLLSSCGKKAKENAEEGLRFPSLLLQHSLTDLENSQWGPLFKGSPTYSLCHSECQA